MAFGVTSFDELNKMVGMKRSEPFDKYFAPMHLSAEKKRERKRVAEGLEEDFLYMLAYMFYAYPIVNADMIDELKNRYLNRLIELGVIASVAEYESQAYKFAADVITVTQRHKDDPYYYSADRARFMAEDQANFIGDMGDFAEALEAGYRYKTWQTVGDNRVRFSHEEVDGLTIPIEEPFELAGGYMMAPHDGSLGVDESELIMCRCTLAFGNEE